MFFKNLSWKETKCLLYLSKALTSIISWDILSVILHQIVCTSFKSIQLLEAFVLGLQSSWVPYLWFGVIHKIIFPYRCKVLLTWYNGHVQMTLIITWKLKQYRWTLHNMMHWINMYKYRILHEVSLKVIMILILR